MNIFHYIFSNLTYFIYKLSKLLNLKNKNTLRVLMYHDIKKKEFKFFEQQIKFIKSDGWNILHPNDLFHLRKNKIKGKNVILTFDDGFFSNYVIERKILSKHKVKAIFFIPYNFMISKNKKDSLKFIKNHLKINKYKGETYKKNNMDLKDVLKLSKNGNVIGYHTRNHIELSKCKSINKLKYEILGYTSKPFERLILKHKFFSFPFGKLDDVDKKSFNYAKKKYEFIFLGIRGENNNFNLTQKIIFRDNFLMSYNKKMTLSILNGYFDILYIFKKIKILNKFSLN